MLQQKLFPDVVVVMEVDVEDVQNRLLPKYLEIWRERHSKREAQLKLLRDLREKQRVKKNSSFSPRKHQSCSLS